MTDHHTTTHLLKQKSLSRRQARWLERIAEFVLNFHYIKGSDNIVSDALSKNVEEEDVNNVTEVSSGWSSGFKKAVLQGYEVDEVCKKFKSILPLRNNTKEVDGLLYMEGRLIGLKIDHICEQLIKDTHPKLGHLGFFKTYNNLKSSFFWPGLVKDTKTFLEGCDVCQRI